MANELDSLLIDRVLQGLYGQGPAPAPSTWNPSPDAVPGMGHGPSNFLPKPPQLPMLPPAPTGPGLQLPPGPPMTPVSAQGPSVPKVNVGNFPLGRPNVPKLNIAPNPMNASGPSFSTDMGAPPSPPENGPGLDLMAGSATPPELPPDNLKPSGTVPFQGTTASGSAPLNAQLLQRRQRQRPQDLVGLLGRLFRR